MHAISFSVKCHLDALIVNVILFPENDKYIVARKLFPKDNIFKGQIIYIYIYAIQRCHKASLSLRILHCMDNSCGFTLTNIYQGASLSRSRVCLLFLQSNNNTALQQGEASMPPSLLSSGLHSELPFQITSCFLLSQLLHKPSDFRSGAHRICIITSSWACSLLQAAAMAVIRMLLIVPCHKRLRQNSLSGGL